MVWDTTTSLKNKARSRTKLRRRPRKEIVSLRSSLNHLQNRHRFSIILHFISFHLFSPSSVRLVLLPRPHSRLYTLSLPPISSFRQKIYGRSLYLHSSPTSTLKNLSNEQRVHNGPYISLRHCFLPCFTPSHSPPTGFSFTISDRRDWCERKSGSFRSR